MTTMFVYVCVVLGLLSSATCLRCPAGCSDEDGCLPGVGCTDCRRGYCKLYRRGVGSVCVMQCPSGQRCNNYGFCSKNWY
ncbi:hypothetical protein DPMN_091793 [Dreissena polymorpha]|uniref:Uncharacterized protein n=1 Tax=Dreissena polymorpha TaxID=45954 RepID=A0A9D4L161_DREPO|nr:hypothetical protein DPMN_091793 [Dreissena polymorpha]